MPFERARDILDGHLNLTSLKPWSYRKGLGYLLRSQDDYRDVFQLRNFLNAHADWKPYLAHILGFNALSVIEHYKIDDALEQKETASKTLREELGGSIEDLSKIDGLLLLKQRDLAAKAALLDAFDFRDQDKAATTSLVDDVDIEIAALNNRRYSLNSNRKRVVAALDEGRIAFDPDDAEKLFSEMKIQFAGQIKKDFAQLIAFNRAISDERVGYLKEERREIDLELGTINQKLNELGARRSDMLAFLGSTDSFQKYKEYSNDLVVIRVDVEALERQRELLNRLQQLRSEIRALNESRTRLQAEIEEDVERQNGDNASLFSAIRVFFSEIVESVIDREALLTVSVNGSGHLEFRTEILDEQGNATSADLGHTYRKLLCIAFDLALLRAHLGVSFPRFVFHDGVFESLDDRKKLNLLGVMRRYTSFGIQSIITAIDSDLPTPGDANIFRGDEVVSILHDEGEQGRLFKMPSW